MANNERTQTFEELVSTTLDAYMPTLTDNIFKSNPTYYELKRKGCMVAQNGGLTIIEPLLYGKNITTAYSRYDVLDTTPTEGITAAIYPWTQNATPISIDRLSERQNAGKHQIIVLLTSKISQAEMSAVEWFNQQLYSTGKYNIDQTSNNPAGFLAAISETPDTYTMGGITSSAETWWRNKVRGNAGTTWTWIPDLSDTPADATGVAAMRWLYNNCSKGAGGGPDFIVGSQIWFQNYEAHLSPFKRFQDDSAAQSGFTTLRYRGSTCYWDELFATANCSDPTSTVAFIMVNSKFMRVRFDSQTNFIRTPFVRPANQDAKVCHIIWYGNMTMNNRRKHGVGVDANVTNIN